MTTETALLRAVQADPAADLPRLVYADHLEDTGDHERAEFVRVQVAVARASSPANSPIGNLSSARLHKMDAAMDGRKLERQQRLLWERVRSRDEYRLPGFLVELGTTLDDGANNVLTVHRGFVVGARCRLHTYLGGPCGPCAGSGRACPAENREVVVTYGLPGPAACERECERCGAEVSEHPPCPTCSGAGRAPGIADRLFADHPLLLFRLIDRVPGRDVNSGTWYWRRQSSESDDSAHSLPGCVFDKMYRMRHWRGPNLTFTSAESAARAASDAVVNHGRSLFGLCPLFSQYAVAHLSDYDLEIGSEVEPL